MGQLTAASIVIFCLGSSVLGGLSFKKVKGSTGVRGKYQMYFSVFINILLSHKGCGLQG